MSTFIGEYDIFAPSLCSQRFIEHEHKAVIKEGDRWIPYSVVVDSFIKLSLVLGEVATEVDTPNDVVRLDTLRNHRFSVTATEN